MSLARRPRVLALGTVSLDTVESRGAVAHEVLGGSAPYFGAAARHSCDVALVGVVGDDFPEHLLGPLRASGIDVSGIEHRPGETFRWHARYNPDGSRETLGTNRERALRGVPPVAASARDPHALFLGSTHPATQAAVLDRAGTPGIVVLDTMIHWVRGHRDDFMAVAHRADVVLMAHDEAAELGRGDPQAGVRALLDGGCEWVVVKRGARGATAFARDRMIFVSAAHPADIADPTGAGDAFAGGLVGGLASAPLDMEGALRQAAALGSLAVETFSVDRLLAVTAEGVEARGREVQIRVEPQGQV